MAAQQTRRAGDTAEKAQRRPFPHGEVDRELVERVLARAFVAAGGAFWAIAAFAGPYVFGDLTLESSMQIALWPFITAVVILIIGWRYERMAAVLLFAASSAVFVWGALYTWELGVWAIMGFVLIGPMLTAAVLFVLASNAELRRLDAEDAKRERFERPAPLRAPGTHARRLGA